MYLRRPIYRAPEWSAAPVIIVGKDTLSFQSERLMVQASSRVKYHSLRIAQGPQLYQGYPHQYDTGASRIPHAAVPRPTQSKPLNNSPRIPHKPFLGMLATFSVEIQAAPY